MANAGVESIVEVMQLTDRNTGEVQTVSLGALERKLSSVIMSNDKMWWWQKRWQSQEIQKLQMRWSKQQRQENITDGYSKDKTKLLKHQQQQ